jgi:hypothetical protein
MLGQWLLLLWVSLPALALASSLLALPLPALCLTFAVQAFAAESRNR